PSTLGGVTDAFAVGAFEIRADAKSEESLDDLALGTQGFGSAAAAATGVLHGEMERSGAGFVCCGGVAASVEKEVHSVGGASSDGAVQGRGAVLVLSVKVRTLIEEAANGGFLSFGVPRGASDEGIGGVMKRRAATMISCCVRIGAVREQ